MAYIEKKRTKLFALPFCFTTYTISDDKINIKKGFLSIAEDDAFMYKIQDVRLNRSFLERIFRIGTITCFTGDTTHPELKLIHIKHSLEIKDYIMDSSENQRQIRRTMHSLDIDAEDMEDFDKE